MSAWLLTIVGITVIGVILELLLTESRMSKFIRGVFAFFVLFVIVQPLPGFLNGIMSNLRNPDSMVDAEVVARIEATRRDALIPTLESRLEREGFNNVIVVLVGDRVFVNAHDSTRNDTAAIISIVTAVMGVQPSAVEVFT
ncbi:MAG: stage III sporulation protein AF [Firmicutes bacterium]|nr:stage III sporulation protein AF [Bacillota bacterium]